MTQLSDNIVYPAEDPEQGSTGSGTSTGADLLAEVEAFVAKYVALPSEAARVAVTLWVAHAHGVHCFESSPRLALLSPEPGSGKTRTLEILELLVPRPMLVLSATPAAVFRSMESNPPTLLFDEVDTIFSRRARAGDGAEELRALLNAGHRVGATIPRCHGPNHDVREFPVYGAVALAGLGDLPDTLMSRSVVIRMRRRAPDEAVAAYRRREAAPAGEVLAEALAAWVAGAEEELRDAWPEMPDGVTDRPADVWESLLAIADAAGGTWPDRARAACVELTRVSTPLEVSLGVRLLHDLRKVFGAEKRLGTETILDRLHGLDESPWGDLGGKPLDARGLARRLGSFGINSTKVKVGGASIRGYRADDLADAWNRYGPGAHEEAEPPEPERRRLPRRLRSELRRPPETP